MMCKSLSIRACMDIQRGVREKTDTDIKRRTNDSLPVHIIFVIIISFFLLNISIQVCVVHVHGRTYTNTLVSMLFVWWYFHALTHFIENVVENKVILHICLSIFFKSSSSLTTYVYGSVYVFVRTGGKICMQLWIKYVSW